MIYGFGAGAFNPVSTPSHLIVVVALGLLLGQQGKAHWKAALPSFIVSLIAGLVLSNFYNNPFPLENSLILLFIALVTGLLVVLAYPIPRWLMWAFMVKAGMVLGLDMMPPALPGISPHKIYLTLAGAACSSSILLAGIALLSLYLHKLWEGIALRVLGSWVTASAMLTLALRFTHKI